MRIQVNYPNPSTVSILLCLFGMVQSVSGSLISVDFTAAEGYIDGNLRNQPSGGGSTWNIPNLNGPFYLVDSSAGTVTTNSTQTDPNRRATYNTTLLGTSISQTTEFTIDRGIINPTSSELFLGFGLSGTNGSMEVRLQQRDTNDQYRVQIRDGVDDGTGNMNSNSSWVGANHLGFTRNAGAANETSTMQTSDLLSLTNTSTFLGTSGSDYLWRTVATLTNQTTSNTIITHTFDWDASQAWNDDTKRLFLNTLQIQDLANTTVTYNSVSASAVPEPSSALSLLGLVIAAFCRRRRRGLSA